MKMRRVWMTALVCAAIAFARSGRAQMNQVPWVIGPFTRPAVGNPVVSPRADATFMDPIEKKPIAWEALHTFNPAAVVRHGKLYVLYRAEDNTGQMEIGGHTSRLGMAVSKDGIHFKQMGEPVFYPADDAEKAREWPGGVEDPRIVEGPDGEYVMTYTEWNRKTYSVGIATSHDLIHWEKHGPAFLDAWGGRYSHLKYKSAGIMTEVHRGRLVAAKIHGQYWMYWGEGTIHLATSGDLIHWIPVEDSQGNAVALVKPRSEHFDSMFPETGPPPVLTKAGIVVVYNGKNVNGKNAAGDEDRVGDPKLGPGAYAAGEALFDANNPALLLARTDEPVLKPELPYEKTGQYVAGTTFAEGLVWFHKKWFLYYGCADSLVAVATAPDEPEGGVAQMR